jgi:DNA-binding MarR family transcriptional regulator
MCWPLIVKVDMRIIAGIERCCPERSCLLVSNASYEKEKPSGLTGNQFNLLMTLARMGPLNVNAVAAAVGMHPSTVPRLIAPLARRRLVRRQAGADRRERVIVVTESGRRKLTAAYPFWAALQRQVVTKMGDEGWVSAMAVLQQVRKSIDGRASSRRSSG